jgi:hypothetical protein
MDTETAAAKYVGYWQQSKRHQRTRLTEADDFGESLVLRTDPNGTAPDWRPRRL